MNTSNRPNPIASQLHTPLVNKSSALGRPESEPTTTPAMAAVRREQSSSDPLGSISREGKDLSNQQFDMMRSVSEANIAIATDSTHSNSTLSSNPKNKSIDILTNHFMAFPSDTGPPPAPINFETIPPSVFGLSKLVEASAWKQAVDLSNKLGTDEKNVDVTNGISLFFKLRWESLFHLKLFDDLTTEIARVLLTFNTNANVSSRALTMRRCNCLALELLQAEVKAMMGNSEESLSQLYRLRSTLSQCNQTPFADDKSSATDSLSTGLNTSSTTVLEFVRILSWRICISIVNTLIRQRYWRRAIAEILDTLRDIREHKNRALGSSVQPTSKSDVNGLVRVYVQAEVVVLCRLSRTYLQIGAMASSISSMQMAKQLLEANRDILRNSNSGQSEISGIIFDHVRLAEGLVLFSQDKYEEALNVFKGILDRQISAIKSQNQILNDAFTVFSSAPAAPDFYALGSRGLASTGDEVSIFGYDAEIHHLPNFNLENNSLMAAAASNLAICALNLRQLPRAIDTLERLIRSNPVRNMMDPVVFNLCTMYDLSCAPEISTTKKRILQRIAVTYNVDDLHWKSFRLG